MISEETRWGIKVEKFMEDQWSFGVCLSHWWDETYVFINLFKWSISIGKVMKELEE